MRACHTRAKLSKKSIELTDEWSDNDSHEHGIHVEYCRAVQSCRKHHRGALPLLLSVPHSLTALSTARGGDMLVECILS